MLAPIERFNLERLTEEPAAVLVERHAIRAIPLHWHDYYELVVVLDGRSRYTCNGLTRMVGPGNVMLLSPIDLHGYQPFEHQVLTVYNVLVAPSLVERHLNGMLPEPGVEGGWVIQHPDIRADLNRAWAEQRSGAPGAYRVVESLVVCSLVSLARDLPGSVESTGPDDPVRRAMVFVDQRFTETITLADVAGHVHLSPNYLSERFHALAGTSFQSYLQNCRLRFARALLAGADATVTEAAVAAGFGSPSHFARAFRKRYGHPPSAVTRSAPGQEVTMMAPGLPKIRRVGGHRTS